MLLGIWGNFEELEEKVSLDELNLILKAAHQREHRHNKFMAALKGHNIDEAEDDAKARFEASKRRAEAELSGKSIDEVEFEDLGIDFEEG